MTMRARLRDLFVRLFGAQNEFVIGEGCWDCAPAGAEMPIDVHALGESCARAMIADCVDCGQVVDLDRYLNCTQQSRNVRHWIANPRPKPTAIRR